MTAQRVTPGVDFGLVGANQINNQAFGTDLSRQHMLGNGKITGDDVATDTSGYQDEYFDQSANSTDIRWTINDTFSIKYIFGYTDYFYDRTTDTELTSNTNTFRPTTTPGLAGSPACAANGCTFSGDRQFYVSQETEYVSHELQFFNDWTDSLTTTTGLFYYQAAISQRGDFYNANDASKFNVELQLRCSGADRRGRAGLNGAAAAHSSRSLPKVDLLTAKQSGLALRGTACRRDSTR